ncbi:hypothetical protein ACH5RR_036687 [Cinchona calisaya]|uniref:Uncharacterized protein n=1 Tax=Cinchona calisaya TaxID=153742 RepID=A0ABD2Y579_9GENT
MIRTWGSEVGVITDQSVTGFAILRGFVFLYGNLEPEIGGSHLINAFFFFIWHPKPPLQNPDLASDKGKQKEPEVRVREKKRDRNAEKSPGLSIDSSGSDDNDDNHRVM